MKYAGKKEIVEHMLVDKNCHEANKFRFDPKWFEMVQ